MPQKIFIVTFLQHLLDKCRFNIFFKKIEVKLPPTVTQVLRLPDAAGLGPVGKRKVLRVWDPQWNQTRLGAIAGLIHGVRARALG